MRIIHVVILLGLNSLWALTLEEIKLNLKPFSQYENVELIVNLNVDAGAFRSESEVHLLQKGADKLWMEVHSSNMNLRTIQSGTTIAQTDLSTGKTSFTQATTGSIKPPADILKEIWKDGTYGEPILQGDGNYLISLIPSSSSTALSRDYYSTCY